MSIPPKRGPELSEGLGVIEDINPEDFVIVALTVILLPGVVITEVDVVRPGVISSLVLSVPVGMVPLGMLPVLVMVPLVVPGPVTVVTADVLVIVDIGIDGVVPGGRLEGRYVIMEEEPGGAPYEIIAKTGE